MPSYFETDHIRGIPIFCAESLKLLFGELRKGYFSFCSACILHLEIAAFLPQHFSAEAVKLMAYGFHLGNREHLSSSPPLSGREAGFFLFTLYPNGKGRFWSLFLKFPEKISPASKSSPGKGFQTDKSVIQFLPYCKSSFSHTFHAIKNIFLLYILINMLSSIFTHQVYFLTHIAILTVFYTFTF